MPVRLRPMKRRTILRRVLIGVGVLFVLALLYLLFWPVPIDPEGWTPEPPVALEGVWARNQRLGGGTLLAAELRGPEAISFDEQGRIVAGTEGGNLVAIDAGGAQSVLASTGGRPLGVKPAPEGGWYVADADRGLLRVGADGTVTVLAAGQGARPFRFTDDLDLLPD